MNKNISLIKSYFLVEADKYNDILMNMKTVETFQTYIGSTSVGNYNKC